MLLAGLCASAQKVSNVSFTRVGKEVTITYSLDKAADIRVAVSVDSAQTWSDWIENLAGDYGKDVQPGKEKQILAYDLPMLRDIPDTFNYMIVFNVAVHDGSVDIKLGDIRIPMMPIEGGTFTMGCTRPNGTKHNYEVERPLHQVTVGDFYMCKYEVTQQLWEAVMHTNPSLRRGSSQLPVEQVSWNDVQIFIARLSQMTGYRFRLPTEAEWEYAARGGKRSHGYVFPGADGDPGSVAWYGMNAGNVTHPVGQLKPNELGLYDMAGNVWEWCSDWFGDYPSAPQDNPVGPKHGDHRILRGGCMNSPSWGCSVSDRSWYQPDKGYGFYGFRLVLDSVEEPEDDYGYDD